jgi:hypothetical protein
MNVAQRLDSRTLLACLPTPLMPMPRLAAKIGFDFLWIKRDDLIANRAARLLGVNERFTPADFVIYGAAAGDGYGQPSPASDALVSDCARLEGIMVDPTYTDARSAETSRRKLDDRDYSSAVLAHGWRVWSFLVPDNARLTCSEFETGPGVTRCRPKQKYLKRSKNSYSKTSCLVPNFR